MSQVLTATETLVYLAGQVKTELLEPEDFEQALHEAGYVIVSVDHWQTLREAAER